MIKQVSQFEQHQLSLVDFLHSAVQNDFVFFGEEHHDNASLENQLFIIKHLDRVNNFRELRKSQYAFKDSILVALEQYFPEHSPILKRFSEGEYAAIKELPKYGDECFVKHTKPILDLCYALEMGVVPMGDKDMVSLGPFRVLDWNKKIAENLRNIPGKNVLTIPILGSRHLERVTHDYTSTPELLNNGDGDIKIAVILQSASNKNNAYLYPSVVPKKMP